MSDAEFFVEAGMRMRELRGTVSQAEFAARLDVDRKTVVRWEAGERLPDGKSLLALIRVFGADVNYLLSGARGGPAIDAAESVLLDGYRRCNAQAKQNLIQSAALLSAGLPAPSGGTTVTVSAPIFGGGVAGRDFHAASPSNPTTGRTKK